MVFPLGIDSGLDFIVITAKKFTPKGDFQGFNRAMDAIRDQVAGSLNGFVILPIPNSLQDSFSHGWEIAEGATEEFANVANSFVDKVAGGNGLTSAVADLGRKGMKNNNLNVDPLYWQQYNGSQPRTFELSWTLVPESIGDAGTLIAIIKMLKKWSAPQGTRGVFVDMPLAFQVSFANPILQTTINMKEAVCTNISVEYVGQGYADFHDDGSPKQVNLSMTFSERSTLLASEM